MSFKTINKSRSRQRILKKILSGSLNSASFILLALAELGKIAVDSFHPKKYAFTALGRKVLGLDDTSISWQDKTLYERLRQLTKCGLVVKDQKKKVYYLSPEGKQLSVEILDYFSAANKKWDGVLRLVIFDIPEQKRAYRDWLRNNLYFFNFKQLQKSVFIGKNPLPESFIQEISNFQLDNFVHLFSIKEAGNKKEILELFGRFED
ncbi:MAG: phenylacetic acid degradation operon negative regulatory protein [Parcubacteria group bacterium LiPW_39]|nr:MAG: phenylacetic acid degradation operon negative regulatory protein [Parcubacteria group bacterium LiPW_39]